MTASKRTAPKITLVLGAVSTLAGAPEFCVTLFTDDNIDVLHVTWTHYSYTRY